MKSMSRSAQPDGIGGMDEPPIKHFIWTVHAEGRLRERLLDRVEIEQAIRTGHRTPRINRGQADWIAHGVCVDGRRFLVAYDHPHRDDRTTARVVTVWDL
jgi:hypothetical protein